MGEAEKAGKFEKVESSLFSIKKVLGYLSVSFYVLSYKFILNKNKTRTLTFQALPFCPENTV